MSSRRTLPALGLLLLLVLPGSKFLWFDGLPLSNWSERAALFAIALTVIPRASRARFTNLLEHRAMRGWGGTFLLVLLIAKLWSYFAFPLGGGFEVCLRSLYSPVESCEKSYEATFLTRDGINALGSISRTDDRIDFGPIDRSRPDTDQDTAGSNWNLPFTNDFPRLSELWLDRLPLRADIGTRLRTETAAYLPIRLVGQLEISYSKGPRGELGTAFYTFSSYEKEVLHSIPIPAGEGVLRLSYEFKEGPVGPTPDIPPLPKGPYATLTLHQLADSPKSTPVEPLKAIPRDEPNQLQGLAIQLLNTAIGGLLLALLLRVTSFRVVVAGSLTGGLSLATALVVAGTRQLSSALGIALLTITAVTLHLVAVRRGVLDRWTSAIFTAVGIAPVVIMETARRVTGLAENLPWNHLMFRGRDSDWLVYQGYARQIFLEQSLRGGESTFYFVPGMRYIALLQHLILGESDLVIALCVFVMLTGCVLSLIPVRNLWRNVVPLLAATSLLSTWFRPLILELVTSGAAEPIAWLSLLVGLLPLVSRQSINTRSTYLSVGLVALAAFVRPNLLFAVLVILVWVALVAPRGKVSVAEKGRAALIGSVVLSFAFFHNLHYGESSTLFTTFVTLDRELTLSELLSSPFNASLRSVVIDKLQLALSWGTSEASNWVVVIAWLLQSIWLVTLFRTLKNKWHPSNLLLLATPVIYLVSMLPFRYTTIPQRHFVASSILFGLSSICCSSGSYMQSNTPHAKSRANTSI